MFPLSYYTRILLKGSFLDEKIYGNAQFQPEYFNNPPS
jgi:hypothetical protein